MEGRIAQMIMLIGANGTGKTTLLKNILARSHQRALVITLDDIEWNEKDEYGNDLYPINELETRDDFVFTGIQRHIFGPQTLKKVTAFKRGIIVFDDCRSYLGDKTDEDIHKLMIRRRQHMVDIMASTHSFDEMPRRFFPFTNYIFLFRTTGNVDTRRGVLKDLELTRQIQTRVNNTARTNPHYYELIKYV